MCGWTYGQACSYIGVCISKVQNIQFLCVTLCGLCTTECPRSVRFSIAAPPVAIRVPWSKQNTLSTVLEDVGHDVFIFD